MSVNLIILPAVVDFQSVFARRALIIKTSKAKIQKQTRRYLYCERETSSNSPKITFYEMSLEGDLVIIV